MVGIVSGSTLGLFNSSLFTLGPRGAPGLAALGAGAENVRLNVATGNLVLQHTDDLLAAVGLDASLLRTYNSQGRLDDDNGDNWRMGPLRRLRDGGAAGRNQDGARAWLEAEDGSEAEFAYIAAAGRYQSTDGGGAYDTLAYDAGTGRWTLVDGDTGTVETYAADAGGGLLLSSTDANGHATHYTYTNGLLTGVQGASGESMSLVYAGNQLVEVRFQRGDLSATPLTRVRYEYDSLGRLSGVVTDLTPADGRIDDGNTYWVRYGYEGDSTRVSRMQQKDGTLLLIGYVQLGTGAEGWRVQTLTDGLGRTTRFSYDTVARTTTVTNPLQQQVVYSHDTQGRLTGIREPAVGGSTALTRFEYDTAGNLTTVIDPLDRALTLQYDPQGRLVQQQDAAGNTLRRSYSAQGLLQAETVFAVPDADGAAGPALPAQPLTTRYVHDAQRNLRFEISAEGRITEHRYDARGQRSATLQYTADTYAVAGLAVAEAPTLAQLEAWAGGLADKTRRQLTEYAYDLRGQLQQVARYATVDAAGAGVADAQAMVTVYVHDSFGLLRQTLTHGRQQGYTYDGLGRLLVSTDALQREVSVSQYDDANRRTVTTLAGGLVRTAQYNLAGELVALTEGSAAVANLGTTRHAYDAAGRLRMTVSAAGLASHVLTDERGRKVADIDADGSVTQYLYDDAGRVVQTLRHAQRADPAALRDAQGEPTAVTLADLNLVPSPDDRREWIVYDDAGRVFRTVDAQGAITEYRYDGASRRVATLRYAAPLASLAALQAGATAANTTPPSLNPAADRLVRHFHSLDGQLLAELDAEGYLTTYTYDAAGRLLEQRRHHGGLPAGVPHATATLDQLRPASDAARDIVTRHRYDAAGRVAATLDAEGYLTRWTYHDNGQVATRTRHATQVASFTPPAPHAEDRTWAYAYDTLDRLLTQTDPDGTVTRHQYDEAGRRIASERAWQSADVRRQRQRFDVQGRVWQELAPEHAALLNDASTAADVEAVFAAYATSHSYDADGRRTAVRDPKGRTTFFYYDADGRLAYQVNAVGEVQRFTYNAFNQLESSTQFAQQLGGTALAGLAGGSATAALRALFDGLANRTEDATTTTFYTRAGQVAATQDAEGALTRLDYNAFGEVRLEQRQVDAAGLQWQTLQFEHDRRGLVTTTTADPSGRAVETQNTYDAFGRRERFTDANLQVHTTRHDRLGRVVEVLDPATPGRATTYDAFDRVLTHTDSLGTETRYEYHRAARSMTVFHAWGTATQVSTTVTYNRHGQQLSVADAAGRNTTVYEYDRAGRLVRVSDAQGQRQSTSYDTLTGTVFETTDGNGVVTRYSYDAVNRVEQRVVDPAGVAATTSHEYGVSERSLRVTDPAGVVTLTRYDRRGQVKSVTADPSGLALRTTYAYDGAGRTLSVTDANGTTTAYGYDSLGRRESETVDPGGLALQTLYAYDDAGHLVARTDPRQQTTRYVNDANGRLLFTVDAAGGITELRYDTEGRVVERVAYAAAAPAGLLPAGLLSETTVRAAVATLASAAQDRRERSYHDALGRLRFVVDGTGGVTEQRFDANGNVTWRIAYARALQGPMPAGTQALADAVAQQALADPAHDRLSRNFFDTRNQLTHSVDGAGAVTVTGYDGAGQVLLRHAYAQAITGVYGLANLNALTTQLAADAARDQRTQLVYDTAGRLVATATAQGVDAQGQARWAVQEQVLDDAGRTLARTARAGFLSEATLPAAPTAAQLRSWVASTGSSVQDSTTRYVHDAAGRVTHVVGAAGAVTRTRYDDAGNVIGQTAYAKAVSLAGTTLTATQIDEALGTTLHDVQNRSTHAVYDAAHRLVVAIDALGHVTRHELDARGNRIATTRHALAATAAQLAGWPLEGGHAALEATSSFQQWLAATAQTHQDRREDAVYDAQDRRTHVVDALGHVRRTDHDALGQVRAELLFATAIAATVPRTAADIDSAVGVASNGTLPAGTRVQRFSLDAAGRLLTSTDAEDRAEQYTYDAVGNRKTYRNRNGAMWDYDHDAAGRMVLERSPEVAVATVAENAASQLTVTQAQARLDTRLAYDALGQLTTRTEAAGLPEARTTTYGYDAAGRQVRVTHPPVKVYAGETRSALVNNGYGSAAARVEVLATLYTETQYDALGRAVANRDVAGNHSYRAYDAAGRLAYEVDAEGAVTGYLRTAFGEEEHVTRFAQPMADLPARAGRPYTQAELDALYRPANATAAGRTLTSQYDQAGRKLRSIEPEALVYDPTRVAGAGTTSAAKVTEQAYNAFGQVVRRSIYGMRGDQAVTTASSTYFYFNRRGEAVAELVQVRPDQAYLTRRYFDAAGNLSSRIEYATALTGNDAAWRAARADTLGLPPTAIEDRHTAYAYDRTDRLLSETRLNVRYTATGTAAVTTGAVATTYGYDGVGNRTRVTVAAGIGLHADAQAERGASTFTYFDALGRVRAVVAPAVPDATGTFIRPVTRLALDAYGNVVQQTVHAGGTTPGARTTPPAGWPRNGAASPMPTAARSPRSSSTATTRWAARWRCSRRPPTRRWCR
jgi:YD repeat-containing protein